MVVTWAQYQVHYLFSDNNIALYHTQIRPSYIFFLSSFNLLILRRLPIVSIRVKHTFQCRCSPSIQKSPITHYKALHRPSKPTCAQNSILCYWALRRQSTSLHHPFLSHSHSHTLLEEHKFHHTSTKSYCTHAKKIWVKGITFIKRN